MKDQLSAEERCAGIIICSEALLGLYLYVKFTRPLFWPFTWMEHLMVILLYVGLPSFVVWGICWYVKKLIQRRINVEKKEVMDRIHGVFEQVEINRKLSEKANQKLEGEIKKLRSEFETFKTQHEIKNIPVEVVQEQTLQNFI
jgi:hypothetical protein